MADIIFIVDSSGSIQEIDPTNWDKVLDFLVRTVRAFQGSNNADMRFALVDFSDDAIVEFYLDSYDNINAVIDRIKVINLLYYFCGLL